MAPPQSSVSTRLGSFASLLATGDYSDLEIRCRDDVYKAHKAIVCQQSEFFRLAVKPENGFQEATSNIIRLHETDPAVVRAVMQYLYSGTYEAPRMTGVAPVDDSVIEKVYKTLILHANTYAGGEIYRIPGLKDVACTKVKDLFPRVLKTKSLADDRSSAFINAVYSTTADTDTGLRAVVLEQLARSTRPSFGLGFAKAVEENPRFGVDMVEWLLHDRRSQIQALQENLPRISYHCTDCSDENDVAFGEILKHGGLRCNSCNAPRYKLVWLPLDLE